MEEPGEFIHAHRPGQHAKLGQPLPDRRHRKRLIGLGVQPIDDAARGFRRKRKSTPEQIFGIGVARLCEELVRACLDAVKKVAPKA